MSKLNLNAILQGGVEEFDENGNPIVTSGEGEGGAVDSADFEPMTEEEQIAQEEADALNEEFPADEAQIDSDTSDLDQLVDNAEGLESIANKLETAIADGGLSPAAAEFAVAAIESYYKPLGETQTASIEQFGGFTTRLTASQEALEGVKATLKKIWEGIKSLVKRVWNWLKEFFRKIFTAAGRLETAVKRLEKRLENHNGSFAEKIEGGKLGRIAIGSTVSVGNLAKMVTVASDSLVMDEENSAWMEHAEQEIKKLSSKVVSADKAKLAEQVRKADKERRPPSSFKAAAAGKGNEKVFSTEILPGNVKFVLRKKKATSDVLDELIESVFGPWRFEKEAVAAEAKKLPKSIKPFSAADIKTVISGVNAIIDLTKKSKAAIDKQNKDLKDITVADGISNEQAAMLRSIIRQYSKQLAQTDQMTTKVLAYCVSTCHGFIAVAHRSLKGKSKE